SPWTVAPGRSPADVLSPFRLYSVSPFFSLSLFTNTVSTVIYTLSLHDALPIYPETGHVAEVLRGGQGADPLGRARGHGPGGSARSEEHTSELQSRENLVCRLLLEKKNRSAC